MTAFTFKAKSSGVLNEFFCCHLFGMPKPVGFEVKAVVKGVVVAFESLEEGAEAPLPLGKPTDPQYFGEESLPTAGTPPHFNFGDSVPLFERRRLRFAIRNLSAIAIPFKIAPTRYKVLAPKAPFSGATRGSSAAAVSRGHGRHGTAPRRLLDNRHEK